MAAGLQGKELATRLGISSPYLSQLEKGDRTPSEDLLNRLANELQTTTHWLLFGSHASRPRVIAASSPPRGASKNEVGKIAGTRCAPQEKAESAALKVRIAELELQLASANETIHNLSVALAQGRAGVAPVSGAIGGDSHVATEKLNRMSGA